MKKGKQYTDQEISKFAYNNNYFIEEFDKRVINPKFIKLINNTTNKVISFLLVATVNNSDLFECIYNDSEQC